MPIDFAACEVQPVVEAALESIRPTAEAKGVRLHMNFAPHIGLVLGDRERLQQVVWNLLSNAVKFTKSGGLVSVNLQRAGSNVELMVTDSGAGIHPDFLPHVFDRFRQADGSTTRTHGGLGLGLAIVRHLVELHGGVTRAESDGPGTGSKFTVTLPLLIPLDPQALKESSSFENDTTPTDALNGVSVLIVDDEFDARELVMVMLQRCGASMKSAGSASEALELIDTWKPDVVIADIGMPIEDGYDFIKRLRALPREHGGATPALALTAYARTEDRMRALSAGYQVHLSKPVDRTELAAVVARLAGRTV